MELEHTFARDEVYPSWFTNALQAFIGLGAFGFAVTKQDNTHIQVVAAANAGAAVVAIQGRMRWIEATITRAHPGGSAGTFDVFVTAADDVIVSTPAPYTDTTGRSFALAIESAGATPTIVAGTVDIFRKVATLQWDGSKITSITPLVPVIAPHAAKHASSGSDPIAPADIGAAAVADLAAEVTNRAAAVAGEAAARGAGDTSEATARAAGDTAEANARIAGDTWVIGRCAVWSSSAPPSDPDGTVVAMCSAPVVAGQVLTLVGVATRILTPGTPATKITIQTDHGSGTGVLSNVSGLVNVTPATGRMSRTLATFGGGGIAPQPLSQDDTIAVVLATAGLSEGIAVDLLFGHTPA